VACEQPQGIMRDTAAGSEQDHRYRLMRYLVKRRLERIMAARKVQTSINHA
jgi:hypothetical protein